MATPNITLDKLRSNEREKSFKILKLRIHPDKHPMTSSIATKLFQDVQTFYDDCCEILEKQLSVIDITDANNEFPIKFRVQHAWPFLGNDFEPLCGRNVQDFDDLSRIMACRCVSISSG